MTIESLDAEINVNPHMVYSLEEDQWTLEEVLALDSSRFQPVEAAGLRLPPGSGRIWVKFTCISRLSRSEEFILDFNDPSLNTIELYQQMPDGSYQKFRSGAGVPQHEKALEGNRNNFLITLEPLLTTQFVVMVYSANYVTISVRLIENEVALSRNINERTFLGVFYGALIFLFLYNLLLFFTMRAQAFLLIGFYTLLVGMFSGASDGFTPQYLYFLVKWTNGYQDIPVTTAVNVIGLWFTMDFLRVRTWSSRYYQWLRWLPYAVILIMAVTVMIHIQSGYTMSTLLGLVVLGTIITGGVLAVRRKVPQAQFFLTAYSIYGIFVLIFILSLFRVIPFTSLVKYSIHLGYLACIGILSYGLGVRIYGIYLSVLDKEKEKQVLIAKKNLELEEKVKERTRDIQKKEINLRSILDNTDNSIWLVDKHYHLIDFNSIFLEGWKLAYNIEPSVGVNLLECIPHKETREIWEKRYENALTGQKSVYQDNYNLAGEAHHFEIHVYPISENGEVTGISFFAKDVTVRVRAQKKLLEQNQTLTKVNRELDSFVYSASHDLKAPLASVLGLVSLARRESDPETRQQYYEMMERSVARLDQFIEDIIDYSRNARIQVKPEDVELVKMIDDIFDDLKYIKGANELIKEVDIQKDFQFKTDPIRLRVILRNILSNAIRYGCLGSKMKKVKVTAKIKNKRLKLSIRDHGPGIPKDQQDKIFDMFYRAHEGLAGTGLGLYIVKETVDKLNGTVEVVSSPKKGAEFLVELPVA